MFLMNFIKMTLKQALIINSYINDISADDKVIFNESNSFLGFSLSYPDQNHTDIPDNSLLLQYL